MAPAEQGLCIRMPKGPRTLPRPSATASKIGAMPLLHLVASSEMGVTRGAASGARTAAAVVAARGTTGNSSASMVGVTSNAFKIPASA